MKVDLEAVADALIQEGVEPSVVKKVVDRLEQVIKDDKEANDAEKEKAPKYEPVIVVTDTSALIDLAQAPMFILEHVDTMNHMDACKEFGDLIVRHNVEILGQPKRKGKKKVIETIGEAMQHLPKKAIKEAGLRVRYKEPVIAQQRDNAVQMPVG